LSWNIGSSPSYWPGISTFSILLNDPILDTLKVSKLVAGGVLETIGNGVSKQVNAGVIETVGNGVSKEVNAAIISASVDLWVPKFVAAAVITGEINESITDLASAFDTLNEFPAGGGGGGAAGIFGDGCDGGNANTDGTGGYGGCGDANTTAQQNTPGATGTTGLEWDGVRGSGSGGAGGNFNGSGNGQNGGVGGVYGGGGGGGGVGIGGSAGLGAQGGDGIVFIQYKSSVTGLYVTVILTGASSSPWLVPSDWSNVNKIALLGAGGCGSDASGFTGGNGGTGGNAIGGYNITGITPLSSIAFHVNTAAEACSTTVVQTSFNGVFAGSGVNGGGTGGGTTSAGMPGAGISFVYRPGLGGPGGTLTGLVITPNAGGLHPWQPLSHW
jgi:hypothetical protein